MLLFVDPPDTGDRLCHVIAYGELVARVALRPSRDGVLLPAPARQGRALSRLAYAIGLALDETGRYEWARGLTPRS